MQLPPMCIGCERFNRSEDELFSCEAFPDGIPKEIRDNLFDHRLNFPGDGGLTFSPMNAEATALAVERFGERSVGLGI